MNFQRTCIHLNALWPALFFTFTRQNNGLPYAFGPNFGAKPVFRSSSPLQQRALPALQKGVAGQLVEVSQQAGAAAHGMQRRIGAQLSRVDRGQAGTHRQSRRRPAVDDRQCPKCAGKVLHAGRCQSIRRLLQESGGNFSLGAQPPEQCWLLQRPSNGRCCLCRSSRDRP